MDPFVAQAQPIAAQAYDPAVQNIQQQIPAIQQLYGALLQGLQQQGQAQVGNVVNSATQRGVASAGITQGTQQGINDALMLQGAQLGVQKAQTVGDINNQVGQANVGRAKAVVDLAGNLSRKDIENQTNQKTIANLNRQYALKQEQNQQDYNIKQIQYQRAQAEAAARAAKAASDSAAEMDLKTFLSKTDAAFNKMMGGDKKVSPETFGKAYQLWTSKGLPESEFINRYKGYINTSHIQDYVATLRR